ncbi:MAG: glucuronyl hydrolase [Citrobacter freundii]|nr:MAG: glucuronyl hydrolase [Citrobacter freundii]
MKAFLITAGFSSLIALSACSQKLSAIVKDAEKQTDVLLKEIPAAKEGKANLVSPRTVEDGKLKLVASGDWTSGFFPGELWYLYESTGDKKWKEKADSFTRLIEKEKFNGVTHDMGFKIYCSFGNGYRLTKDSYYKDVIIQSAKTLITRFRPTTGVIRSWDHHKEKWQFPVIIDNMMNLELLFAATRLTGDSSFYKIAVTHANTTMKNHFRSDFSSYHVVDYDTLTGKVINKMTHQGYADESAWARGQAWALYGYTMCYRETKDPRYLSQAESVASYLLNNPAMPADAVPYWDFKDPGIPNVPRDASAAAVIASGLYELSGYSKNNKQYRAFADKIMTSLTKNYRSPIGGNKGFILIHSTGNKPANSEIDAPINYADYYYLEALLRSKK